MTCHTPSRSLTSFFVPLKTGNVKHTKGRIGKEGKKEFYEQNRPLKEENLLTDSPYRQSGHSHGYKIPGGRLVEEQHEKRDLRE